MVSVCSGCDLYHPLTAGLLGSIAGVLYLCTSAGMVWLRKGKIKILKTFHRDLALRSTLTIRLRYAESFKIQRYLSFSISFVSSILRVSQLVEQGETHLGHLRSRGAHRAPKSLSRWPLCGYRERRSSGLQSSRAKIPGNQLG